MCGILGILRPQGLEPEAARRRLKTAADLMAHRGPDAEGFSVSGSIALGHRRLAILDLDPRANQPMLSKDGSVRAAFNGEIYNFRELREELRALGALFSTESDTEVLIEGYRAWGLGGLLPRLAGMFAFALHDARSDTLYLARDRAGKKPLFYCEEAGELLFASEAKALLSLRGKAAALDPAGLDAYLALKFVPSPGTLFAGVSKVPPGHYLEKRGQGAPRLERFWLPFGKRGVPASEKDCLEELDSLFSQAVRRRLVSDVPVCLFLSGGVDSTLIASELARAGVKDMSAYSIGYEDLPEYNEFEYSRLSAERFPLRYEEVRMDSRRTLSLLQDDALVLDEPISDWVWVPLHELSRRAHQDGFKVVLVGEGSDELFFGYDVMSGGVRDVRRFKNPLWRGAAALGAAALAPVYHRVRRGHRRYDLLRRAGSGEPPYLGSSVGFHASQRHQVAGPALKCSPDRRRAMAFIESLYRTFGEYSPLPGDPESLVSFIEFYTKMGEVLLQRVDRVSMLHSLEARAPFLDHELAEFCFSLPASLKLPEGELKGLLKRHARGRIPDAIIDRPKMGFSFPFKEWLRKDLGAPVESTLRSSRLFSEGWVDGPFCLRLLAEHRSGLVDHAPRLWMLYSLARWYDRWIA